MQRPTRLHALLAVVSLTVISAAMRPAPAQATSDAELKVLFLGDHGHHQPQDRFRRLQPVFAKRNIALTYTDRVEDLNFDRLSAFDGLIVYANIDRIEPAQARALLQYVNDGGGFIPLHCASYCFRNSPEVVALIGGQFQRHETGVFATVLADKRHPILNGFGGFLAWDETYIHHRHNEMNRTVLEYRREGAQADGRREEPWTWVRTHGKGRVFYTAWGHDHRVWDHPGFHNLVERGVRWACQSDTAPPAYHDPNRFDAPPLQPVSEDAPEFDFIEVGPKIPNYPASERWGKQEAPMTKMQAPLPPEQSRLHIASPKNFLVELYASEPQLGGKPIAMTWDELGRLWVCETVDYPNQLRASGEGRDRIRVCEDTDRDGLADHFTLFAEGLSIPTSIAFHRGGIVVQNGVETLYLKDTDGDGRADYRKTLIEGWSLGDTHGGVSNFQYGLDNWIWAMQGYNDSQPTYAGKKSQSFRMGFFRFRLSQSDPPEVEELEFVRSTNNNTWGLGVSEEGIIFGSTANRNPSVYMPIANRHYERVRGWSPRQLGTIADTHLFRPITKAVRQVDQHGGYTAGAGHALYTARSWPRTWWNRAAFVCGPTGHLVGVFDLRRAGADFRSTSPTNLIASDDQWTAPIMAEVGPDGQVWVLDWYNYIVQHNPTPQGFRTGKGNAYESDLRDKKHGRVYRVVYGKGDDRGWPNLSSNAASEWIAALKHPTMLWRRHAQRLLVEQQDRSESVVQGLLELVSDPATDEIGLNVGAIHALHTLHGLDLLSRPEGPAYQAAVEALEHPSSGVRRNAVAVLPPSTASAAAILSNNLLVDPDPQVRLAATLALSECPPLEEAGVAVARHFPQWSSDRWLRDALTCAAATHATGFLEGLAQSPTDQATLEAAAIVGEHLARSEPSAKEIEAVLIRLAKCKGDAAAAVVRGLARGWRPESRLKLSEPANDALVNVLERLPAGAQSQLVKLANAMGSDRLAEYAKRIRSELGRVLRESEDAAEQQAAASQMIALDPDNEASIEMIVDTISPGISPALADSLIEALADANAELVGAQLAALGPNLTPELRRKTIQVMLRRPASTQSLLQAIEQGRYAASDLRLDQKQALAAHPVAAIRERSRKLMSGSGGLPNPDREKVLQAHLALVARRGDPTTGKEIFKKHCAKCHRHRGEGADIGPDLTGMAVHPKTELLTHILDPSRSVEGNFRAYSVITTDGRVLTGMLASETRTSIELVDVEAKRHAIPRTDIDELMGSRKSVMPEGFEKQIKPAEFVDLLEFLTDKGKFVPLDLRKVASAVSTRGMFYSLENRGETIVFSDWKPKTFRGVPFQLTDPRDDRNANVVLLHSPNGAVTQTMPKQVELPANTSFQSLHLLSGVSGWGHPLGEKGSTSMIVRFHYENGEIEDHPLRNGIEFADYIRRIDVPASEFAFGVRGRQVRYLQVRPKRPGDTVSTIQFIKGADRTAPLVIAATLERSETATAPR